MVKLHPDLLKEKVFCGNTGCFQLAAILDARSLQDTPLVIVEDFRNHCKWLISPSQGYINQRIQVLCHFSQEGFPQWGGPFYLKFEFCLEVAYNGASSNNNSKFN